MFIKRLLLLFSGLLFLNNLSAQLCQGSLGDPVVNITFGAGSNPGAPLSSASNNYQFISTVCPNDGFYTIANSTSDCFGGTWLNLPEDHTPGDVNGYMMIVNATVAPGVFYVQTVDGLCGGTTYEFAAWLSNIIGPTACFGRANKPNITFNIETTTGEILQTYTTGDIADHNSPVWEQYGLFFTTLPNTSSVIIRMTNNAPGGCGNDVALDDITFRPCGPKVSVMVNGAAVAGSIDVCTGNTTGYNFTSNILSGYTNTFYQWQKSTDSLTWTDLSGATKPTYSTPAIVTPGKYFYRLAVAAGSNISLSSCRIASDVVTINVHPLPAPKASYDGGCEGDSLRLKAAGDGDFVWTGPGNFMSNTQSPVITNAVISNSGKYYVSVVSPYGCTNKDSTTVAINIKPQVEAGENVAICEGNGTILRGSGVNAMSYSWTPAVGLSNSSIANPSASPTQTTLYTLTAINGSCKASDSVLISVSKNPTANAGPDKAFVQGQFATLNGEAGGTNISYFWTPDVHISSDTVLNPQVSPPYDTAYTLHVVSHDGCLEATDKASIRYFRDVYIPNAFTPNNDGVNDTWNIPMMPAFPLVEVSVYNRYGQLVFFNKGYTKQWDGTFKGVAQSSGVYCYIIDLKNGFRKLSGIVVLIR